MPVLRGLQDGAAGGLEPPAPGDLSVCFECASLSVFTGRGLERRRASAAEELEHTAEVEDVRHLIRHVRER